jgi:outer membrane protein assembly complex protein YaeT
VRAAAICALCLFAQVAWADGQRVAQVQLGGQLLDKKEKLLRFVGLAPGDVFNSQDQVAGDFERLGYRVRSFKYTQGPDGMHFQIDVEPVRTVRHVVIKGNSLIYFDDEIIRHLTLRTGSPLPPDAELRARLDEEAEHVRQFLERDGNFGSTVVITPHVGRDGLYRKRPDWVDLEVRIHLGDWFPVGKVHGEGNHAISNEQLYDLFHHRWFRFGRFSLQRMRDDAQAAEKELRERGYPAARVVPRFDEKTDVDRKSHQVVLPVQVIEKKRVDVRFLGNHALPDKELKAQLTIYETGAYDDLELAESAKAIHRYYQQHGYFQAQVNFSRRRLSDQVEEVTFFVDEGPELKVRRVDFVAENGGALSFSEEQIRDQALLETKPFPALGAIGLGEGGYVTTLQLQQDVERLTEFYRSQGFPQVKVRAEVARDPAGFESAGLLGAQIAGEVGKKDLYVRFLVDEGRRELVEKVEVGIVRGPPGVSARPSRAHVPTEKEILAALRMTAGTPFTEARFLADQSRILTLYRGSGRPYVQISYGASKWNVAHDRFIARYKIDEGPLVTFGEILIRGNFVTRDRVILADLPFRAGDPFDLDKLAEGERNLQKHQIFNSARVLPVRFADHPNPVPILVTVQERYMQRYGVLTPAVGISTDRLPYYYYIALAWRFDNLFGLGSQLELKVDFDDVLSFGFTGRYTDVAAFGPGWRADLTGFYRRELTNRLGEIESYGASLGLTRYLTPTLRAFARLDIYKANINVEFTRVSGPNDQPSLPDDTSILKLVSGVAWDRRVGFEGQPNPLMPVKGWLLAASLGYSPPAFPPDSHQFLVLSAQAQALAPVHSKGGDFTFIANLRFDEGFPINESALPAVERFFAGGATATRGYETDELKYEVVSAAVPPLKGQPGFRIIAQGGNIRVLSTLEFQFPIARTFLGISWPWVGAVFYDVGAVLDAWNQARTSDFKHAVGITLLRILTTFGPLSLEYAYPINQGLAEERWKTNPWYSHFPGRLHLNWGIPLSRL